MAFPSLTPTGRQFTPGDFPNKRFNSQSGAEVRILYGSRRVNATLSLSYANVTDANAESFLDDYSVYQIESLNLEEDGLVTISAVEVPTDASGLSIVAKDVLTPGNFTVLE